MNAAKKLCFIIAILMLFLSGCSALKKPLDISSQGLATSTASNTTDTSQSQQDAKVVEADSANTEIVEEVKSNEGINPDKAGDPIKAAQMMLNNGIIYYISPVKNNKIFFINTDAANQDTSEDDKIEAEQLGDESASELLFFNNKIYYTNRSDYNKIYVMNIDGKEKKKLVDESSYNIVMMGSYIYYINGDDTLAAFDTSSQRRYLLGVKTRCFDSDGTNIYYELISSDNKYTLNSMKIDGSVRTKISGDAPTTITVQDGMIFYTNGRENGKLYSDTVSGKNRVKLADVQSAKLVYSNGWIYYINSSDFSKIYKVQPDGSGNVKVSDEPFVTSLMVNNGTIYFIKSMDIENIIHTIDS